MKKNLLVLGGGEETYHYISLLINEYNIILVDKNSRCVCKPLSSHFIHSSIFDSKKILHLIKKKNLSKLVNGVVCLGTDAPKSASFLAKKFDCISVPEKAAEIASNKIRLKSLFHKLKINTPKYKVAKKYSDIEIFLNKVDFPIIIKPDDSRGSRGVNIAWNRKKIKNYFYLAKNFSSTKTVLIEEFIDGKQISSESIIYKNKAYNIGYSDRNYELIRPDRSTVIENGGDLPTSISSTVKNRIGINISQIAKALNITNGVIKGDIIVKDSKVYILEIALRLSGGYFSSHKIPYSTGVDFLRIVMKMLTNQKVKEKDFKVKYNRAVSQRFLIPQNGKVKKYNQKFSKNMRNIIFSNISIRKSQTTKFPNNHTERLGCVIAKGKTKKAAINNAENFIKKIAITYNS